MDRFPYILGCMLGTLAGDAVGLNREGLSRRRGIRLYGEGPLMPNLAMGCGFYSDDTEHAQMTARALAISDGNPKLFSEELSWQLRNWLLTLPAGIGLATLRSCLKLLVGFQPSHSGVFSAGNGPAMRSAIIGVVVKSDQQIAEFIEQCTRITHVDPKAVEGALLVAQAARLKVSGQTISPIEFLKVSASRITGRELQDYIHQAVVCLKENRSPKEFADAQGWKHGVSGYINHTVPAALYCWACFPDDFRKCVEQAVLLGGDTDTVAAIAGATCGANLGYEKIPEDWLSRVVLWPRDRAWHEQLARSIECSDYDVPSMRWLATFPRNLLFAAIVVTVGIRRLFPPY